MITSANEAVLTVPVLMPNEVYVMQLQWGEAGYTSVHRTWVGAERKMEEMVVARDYRRTYRAHAPSAEPVSEV